MSKVKIELVGDPLISRMEDKDGMLYVDILIPGIHDGSIVVKYDRDVMLIVNRECTGFIREWELKLSSSYIDFSTAKFVKDLGVISFVAEKREEKENELSEFII